MYDKAPVVVTSSRTTVHRTANGGEQVTVTDPVGTVVVGQSGDVQVVRAHGVILTVWPDGTATLVTPNDSDGDDGKESGIAFELPDLATIGNGMTAIPVRYL